MRRRALLYFVKYPEPGKVKTRLAAVLGKEEAARRYGALASETLTRLRCLSQKDIEIVVLFDPPEREQEVREWLGEGCSYWPQATGDLGERLSGAFKNAFECGFSRVMALGSDTLECDSGILWPGFEFLEKSDAVIGPAKDGGYYAIGLCRLEPSLFRDIPWSTPHVLKNTLLKAEQAGISCTLMQELEDLDEVKER